MAVEIPSGAPPRWFTAGYPPLRSLRLGTASPDPDFTARLSPQVGKQILDPVKSLPEPIRDELRKLLDRTFATPVHPKVAIPGGTEVAELFSDDAKKKAKYAALVPAAHSAAEELGLAEEPLSRGGVLYRRWCLECHGPTGGGDGSNAISGTAVPRDYRQGAFKFVTTLPDKPQKGEKGRPTKADLKRTIRAGIDGSMMPAFPQFSEPELEDLAGYVIHLSVRGETEFLVMAAVIQLLTNPTEDDPDYSPQVLEQIFTAEQLGVLARWDKAAHSTIPCPADECPTDTDRLASARRGYRLFNEKGCLGCHQNYGREQQLKWDKWATIVQPRNLVLGVYRGGRRGEDLFARVYAGIDPSTMPDASSWYRPPSQGEPDAIWDVVHFIQFLSDPVRRRQLQESDPSIKIDP